MEVVNIKKIQKDWIEFVYKEFILIRLLKVIIFKNNESVKWIIFIIASFCC